MGRMPRTDDGSGVTARLLTGSSFGSCRHGSGFGRCGGRGVVSIHEAEAAPMDRTARAGGSAQARAHFCGHSAASTGSGLRTRFDAHPLQVWWAVVVVAGLSFFGYAAIRLGSAQLAVVSQDVVQLAEPNRWRLSVESIMRAGGVVPVQISAEVAVAAV